MKIKLDENIPIEVAAELSTQGHDVDTAPDQGLTGCPDADVWQEAQLSGRLFVTQDLDFSDVRRFAPGTHRGLVLVRLATPSRTALIAQIVAAFAGENVESWASAFVVLTETKLRVRRS